MKQILLLILILSSGLRAQDQTVGISEYPPKQIPADTSMIQVALKSGAETKEMQDLYFFEDIAKNEFTFTGKPVKGKYIVLRLKEFLNGELIKTSTIFDERGQDYFKADTSQASFSLFSKVERDDIKLWMKGAKYGSRKVYVPKNNDVGRYAVKDFFGGKKELKENSAEPFYLLAIITPKINEDGSASYCRVAQSEIDPEEFGKAFNIPHYYLVEIELSE